MEFFDQKVAEVFREEVPEMPELPEMKELDSETLDLLQAAGDGEMPADIVCFFTESKSAGGALRVRSVAKISMKR